MKKILVIGAGGHARVIIDAIEMEGNHTVIGLIDNNLEPGTFFAGYSIIGGDCSLDKVTDVDGVIVAIGDNWRRQQLVNYVKSKLPLLPFISVIHPNALVARDVLVGDGTVILAGVVINSGTRIGEHCIINTRASVDHDNHFEDFVSIAPGVTLGGRVVIKKGAAICLGANVVHNIKIGEDSVVGAGALVLDDIEPRVVVVGLPARKLRNRLPNEQYL